VLLKRGGIDLWGEKVRNCENKDKVTVEKKNTLSSGMTGETSGRREENRLKEKEE